MCKERPGCTYDCDIAEVVGNCREGNEVADDVQAQKVGL